MGSGRVHVIRCVGWVGVMFGVDRCKLFAIGCVAKTGNWMVRGMVPFRKKLACNWRSLNCGRVVARIHERAFWITQWVYTYVLTYVQETPTESANVSKLATKEVLTACAFFLRQYICVRLCYSSILLSRRCDFSMRSFFVSSVVVFSL